MKTHEIINRVALLGLVALAALALASCEPEAEPFVFPDTDWDAYYGDYPAWAIGGAPHDSTWHPVTARIDGVEFAFAATVGYNDRVTGLRLKRRAPGNKPTFEWKLYFARVTESRRSSCAAKSRVVVAKDSCASAFVSISDWDAPIAYYEPIAPLDSADYRCDVTRDGGLPYVDFRIRSRFKVLRSYDDPLPDTTGPIYLRDSFLLEIDSIRVYATE